MNSVKETFDAHASASSHRTQSEAVSWLFGYVASLDLRGPARWTADRGDHRGENRPQSIECVQPFALSIGLRSGRLQPTGTLYALPAQRYTGRHLAEAGR